MNLWILTQEWKQGKNFLKKLQNQRQKAPSPHKKVQSGTASLIYSLSIPPRLRPNRIPKPDWSNVPSHLLSCGPCCHKMTGPSCCLGNSSLYLTWSHSTQTGEKINGALSLAKIAKSQLILKAEKRGAADTDRGSHSFILSLLPHPHPFCFEARTHGAKRWVYKYCKT